MKFLKAIAVSAAVMLFISGCDSPNQPPQDQLSSASNEELTLAKKSNNHGKGINSKFQCTDVAPLMTGKNIRAGSVSVTNDGSTLYVTYTVNGGWTLTKTHLNISRGIFTRHNGSGKVNVKQNHASGTTTYTYAIPMQWNAGSKIYIKAHADVKKNKTKDVAYGGKNGKKHRGHWFAFFRYMIKGTPPATYDISGITYVDENSNGEQDADEDGLAGVTLSLSNGSTTVSDENGEYSFTDLSNGSYTVTAGVVSGYTLTTDASVPVVISGASQTVDFGYETTVVPPSTYSFSGFLFVDMNKNGVMDVDELAVSSTAVRIENGTSSTTSADGFYSFTGLTNGTYNIIVDPYKGFPTATSKTITISDADLSENFPLTLSIYGTVTTDGTTFAPGIAVDIYDLSDFSTDPIFVSSTTTDVNGMYIVTGLYSGIFGIKVAGSNDFYDLVEVYDSGASFNINLEQNQ